MRTRQAILATVTAVALLLGPAAMAESPEESATQAAEEWLALVDEGKFDESWEATAALFQAAVTKEQWRQSLQAARAPLGKVVTRDVKQRRYATSLPGAPDGEYVVIQFETSFTNKRSAIETVTPMRAADGSWRVSGYFVR